MVVVGYFIIFMDFLTKLKNMYKGRLKGFPREIVERMLKYQVEQGNKEDISVFENNSGADKKSGGFYWADTIEGDWWSRIIDHKNFDIFFEKYPKTSYRKVMMVGDSYPLTKKRVVFMEKCGKFIAWHNAETLEDAENTPYVTIWTFAEDIRPENPQKQELLNKAEELIQKAEALKAAAFRL